MLSLIQSVVAEETFPRGLLLRAPWALSPGALLAAVVFWALLLIVSVGILLFRRKASGQKAHPAGQVAGKAAASSSSEAAETSGGSAEPHATTSVPVVVLYGTQTGTSEGFAKTFVSELRASLGQRATVTLQGLDGYGASDEEYMEKLSEPHLVSVFLVATYGDGEPTDDAARFFQCLSREADSAEAAAADGSTTQRLSGLAFAVFGLGNRQYEHFNAVGKAVDKKLALAGAQRILEVGLGDDDRSIEDDFNAWKEKALEAVGAEVVRRWEELNAGSEAVGAAVAELALNGFHHEGLQNGEKEAGGPTAVYHDSGSVDVLDPDSDSFLSALASHGHTITRVPLVECRELHTAESGRSCLHLEMDVSQLPAPTPGTGAASLYSPGDHVAVFPQNSDADVARAAQLLGVDPTAVFSLRGGEDGDPAGGGAALSPRGAGPGEAREPLSRQGSSRGLSSGQQYGAPMTVGTALKCLVDLHASPRKAALVVLAGHCGAESEAARLHFLASSAGKEEYMEWVVRSQRSILEVLEAFPSTRPPLAVFLTSVAARLQPRFYSISSSLSECPGRLSVTCSVVEDVMPSGRRHEGVCSFYFKRKGAAIGGGDLALVPIFIRPSSFRLPPNPLTPVIMVGPGTGIAPFRGFLQERAMLARRGGGAAAALGPALMFFGCRSAKQDYLYAEELAGWKAGGVLSALHVAFSRDGPSKVYVQHLMKAQAEEVWRLWHTEGGHLYVCGDAKHMARDVHNTLIAIAQTQGGVSAQEAEDLIREMQREGRYQRDVW